MAMMKAIQELEDTDKGTMENTDRFLAWWRRWNRELEQAETATKTMSRARYLGLHQLHGTLPEVHTAMKSATKTMATKAMKAIQAKTATKTMSTRAMKAKTAMKTMSTRAMKAKKAKTALKTMSKKAMQAMKAKKVDRKSLFPAGTKVKTTSGLKKQGDPLGPIDFALSIHEDRHDKAPEVQVRDDRKGVRRLRPSPTSHKERS